MTREYLIHLLEKKGYYCTYGRFNNFADFCNIPILEKFVKEGIVIKEKRNFFKRLLSSKNTYIYVGGIKGRIVSDIDPFGEEDWTS
jgi:hypothetical protein